MNNFLYPIKVLIKVTNILISDSTNSVLVMSVPINNN